MVPNGPVDRGCEGRTNGLRLVWCVGATEMTVRWCGIKVGSGRIIRMMRVRRYGVASKLKSRFRPPHVDDYDYFRRRQSNSESVSHRTCNPLYKLLGGAHPIDSFLAPWSRRRLPRFSGEAVTWPPVFRKNPSPRHRRSATTCVWSLTIFEPTRLSLSPRRQAPASPRCSPGASLLGATAPSYARSLGTSR